MDNKIQLYFDFQIMLMQKYGGISRYFYDLYKGLPRDTFEVSVPILGNENEYFSQEFPTNTIYNKLPKGHWKLNELYTNMVIKKAHSGTPTMLMHATYYHPYSLAWYKGKLISTVHDMAYEDMPQYFENSENVKRNKYQYLIRSDKIIAVSNTTKERILYIYPEIDEKKIEVIYHGYMGDRFRQEPNERFINKVSGYKNYILYVGRRDTYKNFSALAQAMAEIMKKNKDIHLICAGGGKFKVNEITVFIENDFVNRIIQMDVNDSELVWLYKNAQCFVFPSLYEGFGIPILEAWDNGCPVILSDIPCFREIGKDACRYFDYSSVENMINVIEESIYNDNSYIIKRGNAELKRFTMEHNIYCHVKSYKSIVN